MDDLERHFDELMKDPEFRAEWDAQAAEREVTRCIIEARIAEGITQQELAKRCGMKPANLCRIENGNGNPSVATLDRIARGFGKRLSINFV